MTDALNAMVKSKTAITDVIGSGDDCRFYPVSLPQGLKQYPAASYKWFNNRGNDDFDGASTHDFGYVDIQCCGKNYDDARDLWKTMRKQLEDTEGTFAGIEITGVDFMDSGMEDELDEQNLVSKQLELMISYLR